MCVVLVLGALTGRGLSQTPLPTAFSTSFTLVSDQDCDDVDDLVVGDRFGGQRRQGQVHVLSLRTGEHLLRLEAPFESGNFGTDVCALRDATGSATILVVAGMTPPYPYVSLHDTITGRVAMYMGDRRCHSWSVDTIAVPDVDSDGVEELVLYVSGCERVLNPSGWHGRLVMLSGASGSVLKQLETPERRGRYVDTELLFALGDLDGDGLRDIGVSQSTGLLLMSGTLDKSIAFVRHYDAGLLNEGYREQSLAARVLSPIDAAADFLYLANGYVAEGTEAFALRRMETSDVPGCRARLDHPYFVENGFLGLATCDDANRDGVPDLIVTTRFSLEPSVQVLSGTDLHVISKAEDCDLYDVFQLGRRILTVPDCDSDGISDYVVSDYYPGSDGGRFAILYSTADGRMIRAFSAP